MKRFEEIYTGSPDESFALGKKLGAASVRGDIITLRGELGSGKTVLAKGIASGLGITEEVTSPTYTLLEIYEANIPLYHFDLYRILSPVEFDNLAFEEYWEGNGVSIIEWPERAGGLLPAPSIDILIEYESESVRRIRIEYSGDRRLY